MSDTASSSTPANSTTTPASAAPHVIVAPVTLTVCQLNIHKCRGSDGVTSEARIGDALVKVAADVYSLNEVHFFWGVHSSINQATYLRDYIKGKRGGAWYVAWVNARSLTETRGYGNAVISKYPFISTARRSLTPGSSALKGSPRAVIECRLDVGGRRVSIFSTHLEYYDNAARTKEIQELMLWCPNFPQPHVLMGDFNTRPGSADYKRVALAYRDGWTEAKAAGTAKSPWPSGNTQGPNAPTGGGSRLDYVWLKGSTVTTTAAQVFDMRVNGIWPSDHHPLKVTLAL